MSFKKFVDFIAEGTKIDPKKKDIEEVSASPASSDVPDTCPKCGEETDHYIDCDFGLLFVDLILMSTIVG